MKLPQWLLPAALILLSCVPCSALRLLQVPTSVEFGPGPLPPGQGPELLEDQVVAQASLLDVSMLDASRQDTLPTSLLAYLNFTPAPGAKLSLSNVTFETSRAGCDTIQTLLSQAGKLFGDTQVSVFPEIGRIHVHERQEEGLSASHVVLQCGLAMCPEGNTSTPTYTLQVHNDGDLLAASAALAYASNRTSCQARFRVNITNSVSVDTASWPPDGFYISRNVTWFGQGRLVTALDLQTRAEAWHVGFGHSVHLRDMQLVNNPALYAPYTVSLGLWAWHGILRGADMNVDNINIVLSAEEFQFWSFWTTFKLSSNPVVAAKASWLDKFGLLNVKVDLGTPDAIHYTNFFNVKNRTGQGGEVLVTNKDALLPLLPSTSGLAKVLLQPDISSTDNKLPFVIMINSQAELVAALQLVGTPTMIDLLTRYKFEPTALVTLMLDSNITVDRATWPVQPLDVYQQVTIMGNPFRQEPVVWNFSRSTDMFYMHPQATLYIKDLVLFDLGYKRPFSTELPAREAEEAMTLLLWPFKLNRDDFSTQLQLYRCVLLLSPEEFQLHRVCLTMRSTGLLTPRPGLPPNPPSPPSLPFTDILQSLPTAASRWLQLSQLAVSLSKDPWWQAACAGTTGLPHLGNRHQVTLDRLADEGVELGIAQFKSMRAMNLTVMKSTLMAPRLDFVPPHPGAGQNTPNRDLTAPASAESSGPPHLQPQQPWLIPLVVCVGVAFVALLVVLSALHVRKKRLQAGSDKEGSDVEAHASITSLPPTTSVITHAHGNGNGHGSGEGQGLSSLAVGRASSSPRGAGQDSGGASGRVLTLVWINEMMSSWRVKSRQGNTGPGAEMGAQGDKSHDAELHGGTTARHMRLALEQPALPHDSLQAHTGLSGLVQDVQAAAMAARHRAALRQETAGTEMGAGFLQELHGLSAKVTAGVGDDALLIGEVLGAGAFSTVYHGVWQNLPVAVKSLVFSTQRRQMALKEAALSKSICHPNIVATYSFDLQPLVHSTGRQAGTSSAAGGLQVSQQGEQVHEWRLYIIQEYCDGGSLRRALEKGLLDAGRSAAGDSSQQGSAHSAGAHSVVNKDSAWSYEKFAGASVLSKGSLTHDGMDLRLRLSLALDVARAMNHLHSKNIIHGDLKPENVLLSSQVQTKVRLAHQAEDAASVASEEPAAEFLYRAKVADFGLSVIMEDQQSHVSNLKVGTPFYLAPEVQHAGRVTTCADVYSFGVLLWELASGLPVWVNQKQEEGPGYTLKYNPAFPKLPATLPTQFSRLVRSCLSSSLVRRPRFDIICAVLSNLLNPGSAPVPAAFGDDSSSSRTGSAASSSTAGSGPFPDKEQPGVFAPGLGPVLEGHAGLTAGQGSRTSGASRLPDQAASKASPATSRASRLSAHTQPLKPIPGRDPCSGERDEVGVSAPDADSALVPTSAAVSLEVKSGAGAVVSAGEVGAAGDIQETCSSWTITSSRYAVEGSGSESDHSAHQLNPAGMQLRRAEAMVPAVAAPQVQGSRDADGDSASDLGQESDGIQLGAGAEQQLGRHADAVAVVSIEHVVSGAGDSTKPVWAGGAASLAAAAAGDVHDPSSAGREAHQLQPRLQTDGQLREGGQHEQEGNQLLPIPWFQMLPLVPSTGPLNVQLPAEDAQSRGQASPASLPSSTPMTPPANPATYTVQPLRAQCPLPAQTYMLVPPRADAQMVVTATQLRDRSLSRFNTPEQSEMVGLLEPDSRQLPMGAARRRLGMTLMPHMSSFIGTGRGTMMRAHSRSRLLVNSLAPVQEVDHPDDPLHPSGTDTQASTDAQSSRSAVESSYAAYEYLYRNLDKYLVHGDGQGHDSAPRPSRLGRGQQARLPGQPQPAPQRLHPSQSARSPSPWAVSFPTYEILSMEQSVPERQPSSLTKQVDSYAHTYALTGLMPPKAFFQPDLPHGGSRPVVQMCRSAVLVLLGAKHEDGSSSAPTSRCEVTVPSKPPSFQNLPDGPEQKLGQERRLVETVHEELLAGLADFMTKAPSRQSPAGTSMGPLPPLVAPALPPVWGALAPVMLPGRRHTDASLLAPDGLTVKPVASKNTRQNWSDSGTKARHMSPVLTLDRARSVAVRDRDRGTPTVQARASTSNSNSDTTVNSSCMAVQASSEIDSGHLSLLGFPEVSHAGHDISDEWEEEAQVHSL